MTNKMDELNHGFTLWKKKGVRFFTIPSFEKAKGVTCAISTRVGGVSPKPYDKLNFSKARERSNENFLENFNRFGAAVGFDYSLAVANNYEHANTVLNVDASDAGKGVSKQDLDSYCDGLYTDCENLPLITYHADCVPLFFYDSVRRAVCISHAGWKGVSMHIIKNCVSSMVDIGCERKNILAAIGPCISVEHFEVKQDVYEVFDNTFGADVLQKRDSKIFIDLPKACVLDMLGSGLEKRNITLSDICTYGNKRLFYSHRRDKGITGAMAAVIMLDK